MKHTVIFKSLDRVFRMFITFGFLTVSSVTYSQVNNAFAQYNQFKQQAHQEYIDFRKKCNEDYARFLKEAWTSYQLGPAIPIPEEKPVPPVVMPEEDIDNPIESNPLPFDPVISPIIEGTEPQPMPIAPIYENTKPGESTMTFSYFGTNIKVRVPQEKGKAITKLNTNLTFDNVSDAWIALSDGEFDNLVRDCLEQRIRLKLNDWAYLLMLRTLSENYYSGYNNASVMLTSWLYCQTGYQLRIASTDKKLYLLFGSKHEIFDLPVLEIEGTAFYPLLHNGEEVKEEIEIAGASYPEEKPMSLFIHEAMALQERLSNEREIISERYPEVTAKVQINENLIDFYATYPTSVLGENFCTRWAMYANTPMAKNVKDVLYPQLKKHIDGLSQLDAANILLNWVQTGFVYEYDDKVWGDDRAFFAEESLKYPYCDCEDRSILFTRLVRDLLGLKCILIYYPGHLASAVCFTEQVKGDYIKLNNQKFIITDPTYIGAPVGLTMPDMDNKTAKIILLE